MLVKLAIKRSRARRASARFAGILSGILLFSLAVTLTPGQTWGASPAPAAIPPIPGTTVCAGVTVRGTTCPKSRSTLPAVAPLEGLDVSRWQATINWPMVKAAGKQFVVMKATEGTSYVDPMYATNRAGAMSVGIPMAAYHFASPDTSPNEAVLEADHYVAVARLTAGNLLPALDLEQTGGLAPPALQVWVRSWLDEVTLKLGIRPMIYVSPNFWNVRMANNTSIPVAGYRTLWVANWGVTSPTVPGANWAGYGWTFWQYTDCGHVAGITTGCVDLDRFGGTDLTAVTYNPTFSVVAAPTGQSVTRGLSSTFAIAINRSQFVPPVTLSVTSPMPSGTTYSFSPNPVTGSTSTLTITTSNVPTVTPPGVVTPTITGVGGGLTRTTVANLTVLPALPDAPTAPAATALDASAFVSWTPPANDGGGAISSYVVTSAPGGRTCSATAALSCIVGGLANGTAYTFSVTARNVTGTGGVSTPTAAVTPVASIPGATYFAVPSYRLVDTRKHIGLPVALKSGVASTFKVTGLATIPTGAVAVTGNLTVVSQTAPGYVALTSVATGTPTTSTINFPAGDVRANGVTIPLGPGGKLGVTYIAKAGATTQVIFDVTGYFLPGASGASYFGMTASRVLNTDKKLGLGGALRAGLPNTFQVTGVGALPALKVPAGAIAVTGNLTVVNASAAGYLSLMSVAIRTPATSTLNFPANDIRANGLTIPLGPGGTLGLIYMARAGATARVIFDVTGYFLAGATGASYFGLTPNRLLDTIRKADLGGPLKVGVNPAFLVSGRSPNPALSVPAGAIAVTGNLTEVNATAPGYLSLTSAAIATPTTSTINFPVHDIRANGVTIPLGANDQLWLRYVARAGATTRVIFDVTGYFLAPG